MRSRACGAVDLILADRYHAVIHSHTISPAVVESQRLDCGYGSFGKEQESRIDSYVAAAKLTTTKSNSPFQWYAGNTKAPRAETSRGVMLFHDKKKKK